MPGPIATIEVQEFLKVISILKQPQLNYNKAQDVASLISKIPSDHHLELFKKLFIQDNKANKKALIKLLKKYLIENALSATPQDITDALLYASDYLTPEHVNTLMPRIKQLETPTLRIMLLVPNLPEDIKQTIDRRLVHQLKSELKTLKQKPTNNEEEQLSFLQIAIECKKHKVLSDELLKTMSEDNLLRAVDTANALRNEEALSILTKHLTSRNVSICDKPWHYRDFIHFFSNETNIISTEALKSTVASLSYLSVTLIAKICIDLTNAYQDYKLQQAEASRLEKQSDMIAQFGVFN